MRREKEQGSIIRRNMKMKREVEGKNPIKKPGKNQLRSQEGSSVTEAKEVKQGSRSTERGEVRSH